MPASEDESQRLQVSRLLADWSKEDPAARDALVAIVYKELQRLAERCKGKPVAGILGHHAETRQGSHEAKE